MDREACRATVHGGHRESETTEQLTTATKSIRRGFPGGSLVKNPPANAGNAGSIPGSGRSPGEENGNPLQDACLGNSWTEEPGGLPVHAVAKGQARLID